MDGPTKTATAGASVITFQSAAAVGLIVQDTAKISPQVRELLGDPDWIGAFLTPERARKIAAELLQYADAAQADYERTANMSEDDKRAALRRALGED